MHGPDLSLPLTNPVMIFAIVLLIILILPLLFQRIRIPGMVGLILAGVVIGPHALGILERDATIELLGTVGLLYIMFIAGLEVDMNEFKKYRNRSIGFGTLTFILPQGLGTLMGYFLLGLPALTSILIGAVFASHTLLAYPIASRMGLAKIPAVTTAVGATILTDTAALLVLAVVVRSTEGVLGPMFWVQMAVLLTLFVLLVLWGVPKLGQWFFTKVQSNGIAEFVFVLAVVFVASVAAEFIGVEAIIGAFLAGLALNRLVPEHSTLMNRTQFVGDALFIPFFLISVGMLVDIRILVAGVDAWIVALAMLATVVITKWFASMGTLALFRYSKDEAWMIFGLTIPQAAATLATVIIGYNVGLFDDSVLNGTILMILVTCMIGPWVTERYGRKVAIGLEQQPFDRAALPQRILVPLANPETAPLLTDLAMMIRQPNSDQPVMPLIVVQNAADPEPGVARGEKLLAEVTMNATAAGIPVAPVVRIDPNVANGIRRAVHERMVSTIIIGWNGEGSARHFVFGSILDQVMSEARELVLVSKLERPLNTLGRVLLVVPPYADREPGFLEMLSTAKILASQTGARLVVVHVVDGEGLAEKLRRTKPDVPTEFQLIDEWSGLVRRLDTEVRAEDLIFLVSSRPGTISWRPALERLPRILARRFAASSLVIGYPSTKQVEPYTGSQTMTDIQIRKLVREERITDGLHGATLEDIFRNMLRPDLETDPALLQAIARRLSRIDPAYAPEIIPGVVLFHAHVEGISEPMAYVARSSDGVNLPRSASLVRVVLILLSPEHVSPEHHLQLLGTVARGFRLRERVEAFVNAPTIQEARTLLLAAISAGERVPADRTAASGSDTNVNDDVHDDIAPHAKEPRVDR
ncbi:MAG: cation:proton antiporter [Bacteroidota bacterium]